MRKNDNISVGYGEVPAFEVDGITAWGLPGGKITYSEETALGWAIKLNLEIVARMRDISDLMHARTQTEPDPSL